MGEYDPWGRTRTAAQPFLENYVAEWRVEDPERYESLSCMIINRKLCYPRQDVSGQGNQPQPPPRIPDETVITVVLRVPRSETEKITGLLRNSPVMTAGKYLQRASQAAFDSKPLYEEIGALELRTEELVKLCFEVVEQQPYRNMTKHAVATAVQKINGKYKVGMTDMLGTLRSAVRERKTEVAAAILAGLPDDED